MSTQSPQQLGEERELNDEMVKAELAYHYRQYSQDYQNGPDALELAEQWEQRAGVWAREYQKP